MRVENGVRFQGFVVFFGFWGFFGFGFFFFCAAKKLWFVSFLFTLTVLSCIVSLSVLLFYKHFYNILFYCLNFKSWSRWLSGDMMSSLIYWKCPVQFFFSLIACSWLFFFILFYFFLLFFFFLPSWSHPAKTVYLPQVYWTKQKWFPFSQYLTTWQFGFSLGPHSDRAGERLQAAGALAPFRSSVSFS